MDGAPSAAVPSEGTGGVAARMPLFRFDPGWPFVIAGLALIVSAVLIPAQRELHEFTALITKQIVTDLGAAAHVAGKVRNHVRACVRVFVCEFVRA